MPIKRILLDRLVNLMIRLFRRVFSHSGAGLGRIVSFVGYPAAAAIYFVPDVFAPAVSAVYDTMLMRFFDRDRLGVD